MDEYNDMQHDEVKALVTAGSGKNEALNGDAPQEKPAPPTRSIEATLSTTPGNLLTNFSPHLVRINRLLLMKRRHERLNRSGSIAPYMVTIVVVTSAGLISLLSGREGGACANYHAKFHIINGLAD